MADGPSKLGVRGIYAGWSVVGLGFLLQFIASGPVYYAFGSYAPSLASTFDVPRTLINLAYSTVVLVGAVGSAPVGWLIDRVPARILTLLGLGGTALGLVLAGMTTAYWQVLLLFGTLIATGEAFIGNLTVNYLISHWFERRRGLAIGLAVIGASTAAIVFPPLASTLVEEVGWRMTLIVFGAGMTMLLIPAYFLAKIPTEIPDIERRSDRGTRVSLEPCRFGGKELARDPAFWIVVLCSGSMIGVNGAVMITMVPYAVSLSYDSLQGATFLSVIGLGAMLGKLAFGLVSDRINLCHAQRLGLILMITGLMLLMMDMGHAGILIAAGVYGLALGGMMPVWGALVAHIYGLGSYGTILGYTRAAMTPITIICPLIAGAVFDFTGAYEAAWACFVVLLLLSLISTLIFRD